MGAFEEQIVVFGGRRDIVEICEVPDKNALELGHVPSPAAAGLARLAEHTVAIDQGGSGGIGQCGGLVQISNIPGGLVEVGEGAEDDALVIGPRCLPIV